MIALLENAVRGVHWNADAGQVKGRWWWESKEEEKQEERGGRGRDVYTRCGVDWV